MTEKSCVNLESLIFKTGKITILLEKNAPGNFGKHVSFLIYFDSNLFLSSKICNSEILDINDKSILIVYLTIM